MMLLTVGLRLELRSLVRACCLYLILGANVACVPGKTVTGHVTCTGTSRKGNDHLVVDTTSWPLVNGVPRREREKKGRKEGRREEKAEKLNAGVPSCYGERKREKEERKEQPTCR